MQSLRCFASTGLVLVLVVGICWIHPDPLVAAKKWKIGLTVSPVEIDTSEMTNKEKKTVGNGSYLVNAVGACAECHSCPTYAVGENPFSGGDGSLNSTNYLAGGTNFGAVRSRNLTPNASGRPAGLTQGQFLTVMSTGVNPVRGAPLRSAMPWAFFRFMTTKDLKAIYAYLKEIPSAQPGVCSLPGQ